METRQLKRLIKEVLSCPARVKTEGSFKRVSLEFPSFSWSLSVIDTAEEEEVRAKLTGIKGALETAGRLGYKVRGGYESTLKVSKGELVENVPVSRAGFYLEVAERNFSLYRELGDLWEGSQPYAFASKSLFKVLTVASQLRDRLRVKLSNYGSSEVPKLTLEGEGWEISVRSDVALGFLPVLLEASKTLKGVSGELRFSNDAVLYLGGEPSTPWEEFRKRLFDFLRKWGAPAGVLRTSDAEVEVDFPLVLVNGQPETVDLSEKIQKEVQVMNKLTREQLREVLRWAENQRDKKGRSLLERARESLMSGSYLKYNTEVEVGEGVDYDCDCPAMNRGKHKDKPCKHVIAILILIHEKELRALSKKWDCWFKEFKDRQVEDVASSEVWSWF